MATPGHAERRETNRRAPRDRDHEDDVYAALRDGRLMFAADDDPQGAADDPAGDDNDPSPA